MSDIVLIKDTVEVKREVRTVEVPDYQPQLDALDELKRLTEKAVAESTRTTEILGGSIVEQIATYLQELFAPILTYFNDRHEPLPGSLGWTSYGGWTLTTRKCVLNNSIVYFANLCMGWDGDAGRPVFSIAFLPTGYNITKTRDLKMEELRILSSYWPRYKELSQQAAEKTCKNLQYAEERSIRYNQDVVDTLNNFKL